MALMTDLSEIARLLDGASNARAAASMLRALLPDMPVSVQDALDMRGEAPALRTGGIDVHLMANDGTCWSLTANPQMASAFVLSDCEG